MVSFAQDIDIGNQKMSFLDAERLLDWLEDRRGVFFWRYIEELQKDLHGKSLSAVPDNVLKGIIDRERNLSGEAILGALTVFTNELKETIAAEKRRRLTKSAL